MNRIRIVSAGNRTKVFACGIDNEGNRTGLDIELTGITKVEIFPITVGNPNPVVKLSFINTEFDILAELDKT